MKYDVIFTYFIYQDKNGSSDIEAAIHKDTEAGFLYDNVKGNNSLRFILTRGGNPAKKSVDSDSGFYCDFFASRIRIPILIT